MDPEDIETLLREATMRNPMDWRVGLDLIMSDAYPGKALWAWGNYHGRCFRPEA